MDKQNHNSPRPSTQPNQKESGNRQPRANHQKRLKQIDTAIMASTQTRRGEVWRASKRNSDLVNAKATQHIIDVPVNKSNFNGRSGHQLTTGDLRRPNRLPVSQGKTLKVIPLGGLGEMGIGKNMMALEYDNDIIVIDMGMLFPGPEYPGINYMIPDPKYLEERKHRIRGHIFTHAHLDHIGATKHLLRRLPAPVYSSKFTAAMIQRQVDEDPTGYKPIINILNPDTHERVKLGEAFTIELVRVNHSVPDSTMVVIKTPVGTVINTGDWRFEEEPVDGKKFDLKRLEEIAKDGVLLLMNDSTNCEFYSKGVHNEKDIKESLVEAFKKQPGRIIVSTFSSQIHRIQSILEAAKTNGRRASFTGYSIIQNMELAIKTGSIKVPDNVIMRMEELLRLPDNKIVVIGTGSQGDINAALNKMATGAHRQIRVKATDTVIFSADPIPGNDTNVIKVVDALMREGSHIIQSETRHLDECGPLHMSGHGYREDHLKILELLKPKFYLPIHGEFHMLVRNAELAVQQGGVAKNNAFVLDNGDVLELTPDSAQRTSRVSVGAILVDQAGGEVSDVVVKDRIHMSMEGIFTVILTLNRSGQFLSSPDIISRGFIYLRDSEELMSKIRRYLKQKVTNAYQNGRTDVDNLKKAIREDVAHILYDETERTPIVICVINEIASQGQGGRVQGSVKETSETPNPYTLTPQP